MNKYVIADNGQSEPMKMTLEPKIEWVEFIALLKENSACMGKIEIRNACEQISRTVSYECPICYAQNSFKTEDIWVTGLDDVCVECGSCFTFNMFIGTDEQRKDMESMIDHWYGGR